LTATHPIKPTSTRCPSAWQPNPGRDSTYRCGKSVQTTGTTTINVTDQAGYEASGVDKVRDAIKAGGGKLIAGGYNKATTLEGDVTAANRFLVFQYPSKEAHEKVWISDVKPWIEKVKGKYTDRFRVFGVEAAEQK
jgi:uncharacterized protein (DUF1330 family)